MAGKKTKLLLLQVILSSYDSRWIIFNHLSITLPAEHSHTHSPSYIHGHSKGASLTSDAACSPSAVLELGRKRTEWQSSVNSAPQLIYWHCDFAGLSGWEFNLAGLNFTLSGRRKRCLSVVLRENNLLVKVEFQGWKLNNTCKYPCYLLICDAWPV